MHGALKRLVGNDVIECIVQLVAVLGHEFPHGRVESAAPTTATSTPTPPVSVAVFTFFASLHFSLGFGVILSGIQVRLSHFFSLIARQL